MTSDGVNAYSYNAKNQMVTGAGASIIYDAEDRLLAITKAGVTTKFLYDGTDIIAEFDASNNLLRKYVHGGGTDEPLVWYEGANKYFLHADNQGSITSTTDGNGTVINISTYDAYGKRTASNDNYSSRFSYTGQAYLKEISLYYYKARIYNQNLGRFMQTDPIGYGDGMNWYNYVGGDPVNGSDPSGMNEASETVVVRGHRDPCRGAIGCESATGDQACSTGRCGSSAHQNLPQFAMLQCTGSYCYSAPIKPDKPTTCPAPEKGSMGTTTEDEMIKRQFYYGGQVMGAKLLAESKTESYFANTGVTGRHNNIADAYRHFTFNYLLTNMIGASDARKWANAHEVTGRNELAERNMDLHNNSVGRSLASSKAFNNSDEAFEWAKKNGCLIEGIK